MNPTRDNHALALLQAAVAGLGALPLALWALQVLLGPVQ